jgi:hypothetical protein
MCYISGLKTLASFVEASVVSLARVDGGPRKRARKFFFSRYLHTTIVPSRSILQHCYDASTI